MKKILFLALAIAMLASCNNQEKQNLSKNFALPAYEKSETAGIQTAVTSKDSPALIVLDTILQDGSRLITLRIYPDTKPPADTIPQTPDTTSIVGIGANTFPWIPLDRLQMFSTLRCYISSGWIWRPGGLFVQPMYQAETAEAHGLDDFFQRAKDMRIDILPCINQTPEWYRPEGNGTGSNDFPPIKRGLNRTDPKSYKDYAEFWYQFCARYGSTKHLDSDLRVDQTPRWPGDVKNVKKSGLGLIKYVEIGNEFDRWWNKGTEQYVTPQEHVAILVAVMDAIKRADPKMKIVMAGLTGFDLTYLKAMDAEFRRLGKPWPDVINVHHYSHEGNQYGKWPPTWWNSGATYPEYDKDFAYAKEVLNFCKSLNRPLWVTEYGADTKPESWMHIKGSKWGISDEQAQGALITKTMVQYRQMGVQRSYMFMAADEPGSNGGLWQTCGLMRNKENGYAPKASYEAVKTLLNQMRLEVKQNQLQ